MSRWTEKGIRDRTVREQDIAARLTRGGKDREATEYVLQGVKKGLAELLDLPYLDKKIRNTGEYRSAKRLTDKLFARIWKVYWGASPFPLQKLMEFGDADYMVSLYQGMDVMGLFNQYSAKMDERLRVWILMGFYAFQYELAAKPLIASTEVLTAKSLRSVGEAVALLTTKYQIAELADYFDPFLRNAINHSQYYVKTPESGIVEAWNAVRGRKSEKRRYELRVVYQMTVMLMFFIIAYYASWYELTIELGRRKAFHKAEVDD